MRWHRGYAALAGVVLITEIAIALFIRDRFVRPLGGDALAVVLVYLTLRAVTSLRVSLAVTVALGMAVALEFGQLFGLVDTLGLGNNAVARTVLGTGFDPQDFVAYAVGAALVTLVEAWRGPRRRI